jgi:hypothetical protein
MPSPISLDERPARVISLLPFIILEAQWDGFRVNIFAEFGLSRIDERPRTGNCDTLTSFAWACRRMEMDSVFPAVKD